MLGSDYTNYSEADSTITTATTTSSSFFLTSEGCSSDYPGSEIDMNGEIVPKKLRSKPKHRAQKKVKYWTLPTMSSGTFDPSMLTARQQLQYLSQKSKLGEESESLELSPLRLDRIKFEEMRSMGTKEQSQCDQSPNGISKTNTANMLIPSSPSSKSVLMKKGRSTSGGSKLKEEIASSPTSKVRKSTSSKKEKKQKKIVDGFEKDVAESDNSKIAAVISTDSLPLDAPSIAHANSTAATRTTATVTTTTTTATTTATTKPLIKTSLFADMKNYLFNYTDHRQKHLESFLKDFAKRLGLSENDERVQRKRDEIINKGMI